MIAFVEPIDGGVAARAAIERLDDFDWVVLTSPNGARTYVDLVQSRSPQASGPRVACVGPGTARVVEQAGRRVDLVPDRSVAEGLVASFPKAPSWTPSSPSSVLVLQAEVTRDTVADGLRELGWTVERVAGYRTIDAELQPDDRAAAAAADVITFMSSSSVERFVRMVGADSLPPVVACIGPITADTARDAGVQVTIEADVHTLDGLLDSLVEWSQQTA